MEQILLCLPLRKKTEKTIHLRVSNRKNIQNPTFPPPEYSNPEPNKNLHFIPFNSSHSINYKHLRHKRFYRNMKFEKILKSLIEKTLPSWRDKFLCYKILKKQLNLMCSEDGQAPTQMDANQLNHFLNLLQLEIDKFNTFFIEKEEEYVIKGKELQDRVVEALDLNVDLMSLGREIVDFHGEMVLLENYSALNYTGLVKIIKKHDKKTGALLRSPFIQDVVKQPFYEIDVINKLVKECEVILSILFTNGPCSPMSQTFMENGFASGSINENEETVMQVPEELSDLKNMKNMYIQLTLSALHTLEQIRGRTSTMNMFSSPSQHN